MDVRKLISIIVPCYNEEESIPMFHAALIEIERVMDFADFEYVFIDDGSKDKTLQILRDLSQSHPNVKYISFSRNFGKEAALFAGLQAVTGDYVAVMDADLQDPPELLPKMYEHITEDDYDCVATYRSNRAGEPPIRSLFARLFYFIINKISDTQILNGARDYRLMTRQVVDSILSLGEYNRFSKGLFNWVGFNTKYIEFENVPRVAGSTKWNFWQLFLYSLDGIVAFSVKPLAISSLFGMFFCLFALLGMVFIVIRWLIFGDPVAGWASTVTIVLFVGGVQLFCTGILGWFLSKTYMEVKGRPQFIVRERSDITKEAPWCNQ